MKIVEKPICEVKPYENNPRHNEDAVEAVANSIREFGFKQPLVIDSDGVVIVGHTRLLAAKRLGFKTVPCLIASDLTPSQIQAYRLADNKTNELADWDFDKLAEELDGLTIDFDMSDFGFDLADFEQSSWFDREKEGKAKQDGNDEYNDFVEKFEPKKTTDDCYTPDNVYEAVLNWVVNEFDIDRSKVVRPFYPGGDYQSENYAGGVASLTTRRFRSWQRFRTSTLSATFRSSCLRPHSRCSAAQEMCATCQDRRSPTRTARLLTPVLSRTSTM